LCDEYSLAAKGREVQLKDLMEAINECPRKRGIATEAQRAQRSEHREHLECLVAFSFSVLAVSVFSVLLTPTFFARREDLACGLLACSPPGVSTFSERASAERVPNRRSRWHSCSPQRKLWVAEEKEKARERGRHKGLPSGMPLFVSKQLCRPRSRAWVASIPNPQLALWATTMPPATLARHPLRGRRRANEETQEARSPSCGEPARRRNKLRRGKASKPHAKSSCEEARR
jgi:hypothetical protein